MVVLTSSLAISERNLPGSPDHAHRWEHLEGTQVSAAPCLQANGKGLPPSENRPYSFFFFGGDEEDRTPDLRIANATLSQLSYVPTASIILANQRHVRVRADGVLRRRGLESALFAPTWRRDGPLRPRLAG